MNSEIKVSKLIEEFTGGSAEIYEGLQNKFLHDNETAVREMNEYLMAGVRPKNDEFVFYSAPDVLRFAGISSEELVIKTSVLNKAIKEHGLTEAEVRATVRNIADPILIFNTDKNASENLKDSILALTDVFAQNGKPVAFSMNLDDDLMRGRIVLSVNQITSIHDRTLTARNGTDLIQKWTNEGFCRYVDDKKISDWQLAAGVQFPLAVLQSDDNNILTKSGFVNNKEMSLKIKETAHIDKGIESIQTNAGMSEPAIAADYEAENNSRPDYFDEQGNPHRFAEEEEAEVLSDEEIEKLRMQGESAFGISEDDRKNLKNAFLQIDDYLENGVVPAGYRFILPKPPLVLSSLGSKETDISVPVSVIKKAKVNRNLSDEQIKSAIEKLYDPVIVFDSDKTKTKNKAESHLVLTDVFSAENKPIALAINSNANIKLHDSNVEIEVQDIRSIHDRTLITKNGTDLIQKWTENGLCRYVDDKKISEWCGLSRVYFPVELLQSDTSNILTKSELVNIYLEKQDYDGNEQIKTAGGDHVRLQDAISNRIINSNYNKNNLLSIKDLHFSKEGITEKISENNESNTLEQSALNKAAEQLRGMSFNSDNYKDLLSVINKISSMSGQGNTEISEKKEVGVSDNFDNAISISGAAPFDADKFFEKEMCAYPKESVIEDTAGYEAPAETETFDPNAPIVYGETVLPSFAVLVDGKLQSVENAVVTGFDKTTEEYAIDNGTGKMSLPKATFETLLKDKGGHEVEQRKIIEGMGIVFSDEARGVRGTVLPEFSLATSGGIRNYKNCVVRDFNAAENTYTLTNGDTTLSVPAEQFAEISSKERFGQKFDENSKKYEKLLQTQYDDFFKPRANTAYNFRHNLSVYCRKEANSPCDALHLAKEIISRMPKEEQTRTRRLLQKLAQENESMNELIVRTYHDAVEEMPLNENYIKQNFPDKVVARPFYDTVSDKGKNVDNDPSLVKGSHDYNLKIGDTLKNVNFNMARLFGSSRESVSFDELKVVSASKEGNTITLMDGNRSYYKLPRDTVLASYKERQVREIRHGQRQGQAMSLTYV